jgi:hypothetical protein
MPELKLSKIHLRYITRIATASKNFRILPSCEKSGSNPTPHGSKKFSPHAHSCKPDKLFHSANGDAGALEAIQSKLDS